ncbi:MAG: hypothetical protein AAB790_03030 [Patescibacteria group bacterium]
MALEKVGGDIRKPVPPLAIPVGESSRENPEDVLKLYDLDLNVLAGKVDGASPRVIRLLGHLHAGVKGNKALAEKMEITPESLSSYLNSMYHELGLYDIESWKHKRVLATLAYRRFLEKKAGTGGSAPPIGGEGVGKDSDPNSQLEAIRLFDARRLSVLKLCADGSGNQQIADALHETTPVVQNEMYAIYKALSISRAIQGRSEKRKAAADAYRRYIAKYGDAQELQHVAAVNEE